MPHNLILLSFIILIIYDEYKLRSSSLCSVFKSSITSSLLGPNIFLNNPSSAILNPLSFFIPNFTRTYMSLYSLYRFVYVLRYESSCAQRRIYCFHCKARFSLRKERNLTTSRLPCCLHVFSLNFKTRIPMFAKHFITVAPIEDIMRSTS
jgi:hypothetical protein